MIRRSHFNRRSFLERVAGTFVAGGAAFTVTGCASTGVTDSDTGLRADAPGHGRGGGGITDRDTGAGADPVGRGRGSAQGGGMRGATGWNGASAYVPENGHGTAEAIDVNGDVGHPLTVSGPTANCPAGWSASPYIVSGQLPPGLAFGQYHSIAGIPTARGHWIVTVALGSRTCGGMQYEDIHQQIRFHITGGGTVVQ